MRAFSVGVKGAGLPAATVLRVVVGLMLSLSGGLGCRGPRPVTSAPDIDAGMHVETDSGGDAPSMSIDEGRACVEGTSCVPGNPCHEGATTCAAGVAVCGDTQRTKANGSACDYGSVCRDGACVACADGTACEVVGKPCRVGRADCSTGASICVESDNQPDGTACGPGNVCEAGTCTMCTAGGACTPANPCHKGALTCTGSTPVCNDTGVNLAGGNACGAGMVCNASGACGACVAGSACAVVGNACRVGTTTCSTGTPVCLESGNAQDGMSCGTGQVCSGGVCVACSAGLSCVPTNPCHSGTTVCAPTIGCVDSASVVTNGTACGTDKVCSNGTCVACAAGKSCQTTNACKLGTTSCATGVSTCVESGNASSGTTCGSNMVCSNGACVTCSASTVCQPANPCHTGSQSCSTGGAVCTDTGTALADGTSCGSGLVCRVGLCVTCVAGVACQPANACKTGTTSCSSGSSVCVESGNKTAGSSCGTGMVCNTGSCATCTAGGSCTPANSCHQGTLSCATGMSTCTDTGSALSDGSPCGTTNFFCKAGVCGSCTPGLTGCGGNPNPCKVGVTSCATGVSVCVDSATNKPPGSMCGSNAVCSSTAACVSCVAGMTCKASNLCHNGAIVCSSGAPICTDLGTNMPDGTNCGPATGSTMFCNSGTCGTCTPNAGCQPTNPCKNGVFSCATGVPVCSETTNKAAGTSCGSAQVCTAGVQTGANVCDANGQCPAPAVTTCPSTGCNASATACNAPCSTGQVACGTACCAGGQGCCGGVCAALNTPAHCGSCAAACATGVMCLNGACGCPAGQASCGGGPCVDVLSSPGHCGASCQICSGTSSKCASGACVQCLVDTDCPAPAANTCAHAACVNHACTFATQAVGASCSAGGTCAAGGVCVRPQVTAGSYAIDATEVTKGQYAAFVQAKAGNVSGQPAVCAWNTTFQPTQEWPPSVGDYDMPVGWVDWCDAFAYCASAGRRLCGKIGGGSNVLDDYANPALSQWMGACVGPSNFGFPYGNTFDPTRCNSSGSGAPVAAGKLTGCVGGYPGLFDMSGNLMEWEDSCLVVGTTGNTDLCRNRGGSFVSTRDDASGIFARCDTNNNNARSLTDSSLGFRCCGL